MEILGIIMKKLKSYVNGSWIEGAKDGVELFNAVNGEYVANISSDGIDFKASLEYARNVGGKNLRKYTFHDRSLMLKAMAKYLLERKAKYYAVSAATGATKTDSWIDIEGGINTVFTMASKGRRELPNEKFYVDGVQEALSKNGTFIGHHIAVPLEGAAIHINAFNFPVWGMLEKMAPSIIAGVPVIFKPASLTAYLTEAVVQDIIESGIFPEGAVNLICGSVGDMLSHVNCQDVITFTGSAYTGKKLKTLPAVVENSVRFNMEADSLNFAMLGPDAAPGTAEFDLFVKEVMREMTVKAGQKCTAIRRVIVPENYAEAVIESLKARLDKNTIGDPSIEGVRMGPLAGKDQVEEVRASLEKLKAAGELVYGGNDDFKIVGGDKEKGAFFSPSLLYCQDPWNNSAPHDIEAFGPVATVMPYKTNDEAFELAKLGKGSLVGSVFTGSDDFACQAVYGTASYHGRVMLINKDSAAESTGHGSPMPHLVHGGPGRAGGGEELGGIRSVLHYMQRTAIQGHPTTLSKVTQQYLMGAERKEDAQHPFTKYFEELELGDTLTTHRRTVTTTDIVNFTGVSWDNFYAHTDVTAIPGSIFERRVAHGYFVISAAAGLFVSPKKGPVLANYGLDELRFIKPVYAEDTIYAKLTVKSKQAKEDREGQMPQGVVKWLVEVFTVGTDPDTGEPADELAAIATILTLVERKA